MKAAITIILILIEITTVYSQKDNASPELKAFVKGFEKELGSRMEQFHVPGIAIAIIENGSLAYISTQGNKGDARKSIMTDRTIFNIGSISKTFTAWGILKLVGAGKIELDAPVSNYLKKWKFPESSFDASKVTVRMLLSHTAGVSMRSVPAYLTERAVPSTLTELNGGASHPPVRIVQTPGSGWRYSGGGYLILQQLVEEISGTGYEAFMKKEIFAPLGMNNTSFEIREANMAVPININLKAAPYEHFAAESAAGVNTTISDFVKFVIEGVTGKNGILSNEQLQMAYSAAPATKGSFGLGYFIDSDITSANIVGHDGANTGWRAVFKIVPSTKDGIVVLTNSSFGAAAYDPIICKWLSWKSGDANRNCSSGNELDRLLIELFSKGLPASKMLYTKMKTENPSIQFSEGYMGFLGGDLYEKGFSEDAISLLELNTNVHPDVANAFNTLGDICIKKGDTAKGLAAYEQALKIEPGNATAVEAIRKIR